jgi:prephenate dehydratase
MPPLSRHPRAGYLGPEGTFSEEALLSSIDTAEVTQVPLDTIRDAVIAVQEGEADWSLVPIENSIEGSVTVTLDALVGDAGDVEIVGEAILPVRHCLIAAHPIELAQIDTIVSHPHVPGQCTRFLHERLSHARVTAASSTAEAVRLVAERTNGNPNGPQSSAAIGTRLAAELYGCTVIAEGIQDRGDNETRFVWLARKDSTVGAPPLRSTGVHGSKTSLVFWGAGADRAGWLVRCLDEFARRAVNLTKIESRPMRERLGQYMFFVDLEGSLADDVVSGGVSGLSEMCQHVRVLGSYPTV